MNKGDRVHLIRPGQTGPGLIWRIVDIHAPYALIDLVRGSFLGPQRELLADLKPITSQPDPTKTGPCELQLSFACTGAGYERLDPRDMLAPETSFRTPRIICLPCYELAADHYISEVHS